MQGLILKVEEVMSRSKSKRSQSGKAKTASNKNARASKPSSPLKGEVLFWAILVVSILMLISLFGWGGIVGGWISNVLFGLFGAVAYIFPILMTLIGGFVVLNSDNDIMKHKAWYGLGFYLTLCGIVQWFFNSDAKDVWDTYTHSANNHSRGGFIGGLLSYEFSKLLGRAGDLILLIGLLVLFFILFSRKLIFHSVNDRVRAKRDASRNRRSEPVVQTYEEPVDRHMQVHTFDNDMRKEAKAHASGDKKGKKGPAGLDLVPGEDVSDKDKKGRSSGKRRKKEMSETATLTQVEPDVPETKEEKALKDVHIRGIERNKEQKDDDIFEKELNAKFGKHEDVTSNTIEADVSKPDDKPDTAKPEINETAADDEAVKSDTPEEPDTPKKKLPPPIPYEFPPIDLLSKPKDNGTGISEKELKETAIKLKETLENFGVGVSLGDISVGPSVTRYELIPDQGVRVNKITSLADDLKLTLAAADIRIEAPIPGKSAVGIEVPNAKRVTITLRELLESEEFKKSKSKLSFAVGKDISGKTIVTDIAKMPHVLVAGSTGSGKSVLINTLIMSIIFKADPNEVKLIMVDPKMVEFMAFAEIPHLMIPVVDDPKKASAALAWAVAEMESRYKKFADLGIRDIATYNSKISKMKVKDDPEYQRMPQIVIIVDEFADLMMVASHDVEDSVMRLAQKARAAGIHLVLATQRPSVNVITGVIKANIPSRIALSVSSQVDSRTIIDSVGAEKLLGNGDMLFAPQSLPQPIRVQGAFVSDDDRDKVVTFLKEHGGAAYDEGVTASIETVQTESTGDAAIEAPVIGNDRDEYFAEAGRFIIEKNKASIGALQRAFRIGFNRAARIMDQLSDAGVVGPEEGTKAREILMDEAGFEAFLSGNDDKGQENAGQE